MNSYDHNDAWNLKTEHVIEITLQAWDYHGVETVRVGGNCAGGSNFETAVGNLYDRLEENVDGSGHLVLQNEGGDTLEMEIGSEDELLEQVVGVRIVSLEKKEDKTEE